MNEGNQDSKSIRGGYHRDARERVRELLPRILRLRKNGHTYAEVGRRVGLKKATVMAACRRNEVVPEKQKGGRNNRRKGEVDEIALKIHGMRREGKKGSEIAVALGLRDRWEVKDIVKSARRRGLIPAHVQRRKWTKDEAERAILDYVRDKGRYVNTNELMRVVGLNNHLFKRFNISVPEINRRAGFREPFSVFQQAVEVVLAETYERVLIEQKFEGCVSPKGFPLRFDLYVPEEKLLVEADGVQHDPAWREWDAWEGADYRKACDEIKNAYAAENGYVLVRVPYVRFVTREHVEAAFVKAGTSLNSRELQEQEDRSEENMAKVEVVRYETAEEWLVRGKGIIDGAETLEDAARMADAFAAEIRQMIVDGWKLAGPVHDDYAWSEHPGRIKARRERRKQKRAETPGRPPAAEGILLGDGGTDPA